MRARMRANLDKSTAGRWDVKQGDGGLIDIEFVTQFLVLRDAHRDPAIVEWSDNWRQLDALAAAGSIGAQECENLIRCYRRYRAWTHSCSLQNASPLTDPARFADERETVRASMRRYLQPSGEP